MITLLIISHLLWSCAIISLWSFGQLFNASPPWLGAVFVALQLYAASQLLLPSLLLHPEQRDRGFYLFWGVLLLLAVWLVNQLTLPTGRLPLLAAFKSSLLLMIATLTGAAMARYLNKLWELLPVCIVMTLADFASWLTGPTSGFVQQLQHYYLTSEGPPPLIDMALVKLVFPGNVALAPVFGLSDWIMVVFFAIVARRYGVNDNLIGPCGEALARQGRIGRYLPLSVVALFIAVALAQLTGLFIPALPIIALVMLLWYSLRYLLLKCQGYVPG